MIASEANCKLNRTSNSLSRSLSAAKCRNMMCDALMEWSDMSTWLDSSNTISLAHWQISRLNSMEQDFELAGARFLYFFFSCRSLGGRKESDKLSDVKCSPLLFSCDWRRHRRESQASHKWSPMASHSDQLVCHFFFFSFTVTLQATLFLCFAFFAVNRESCEHNL